MAAEPIETTAAANRNKAIVSALCNRFSLDPNKFTSESIGTSDIMSLFTKILLLPGSEVPLKNQPEVITWVEFASNFPSESEACHATLRGLNENLAQKTVLLGHGFHPSEADIVVFPTLHAFVSCLSEADKQKYPNVIRWMDYIQQKEDFGGSLAKIVVNKPGFEHFDKYVEKTGVDQTSNKVPATSKDIAKSNKSISSVKGAAEEEASMDDKTIVDLKKHIKDTKEKKAAVDPKKDVKETKEKKAAVDPKKDVKETKEKKAAVDPKKDVKETKEKKKQPEKESSEKDAESRVTILNIRVGLIRKAWKHPSADSLLVEEIDLGDGNLCQVVSGLAKYCSPEDLTNRRVVLITNVKPGKLRDVMSTGLVLCASSGDHSVVEPLIPPEGAIVGERITFLGYEGKPEDVLNPKKKQLEKITPHLYTDDKGIATYKGVPFMTSAGPCTSSISSAGIK